MLQCRYGVKVEAVSLLQEWVRDIGSQAGLTAFNTQINSGSLGVPESRMEVSPPIKPLCMSCNWGSRQLASATVLLAARHLQSFGR